ncbi:hypothetical protein F2981_17620 [Sinorhizobium meliloti]|nr:hypothetical protein [Sinorhizobium meliloti]
MVGQKPVSRRCFGIAFVSRRPPVMMDRAAFSFFRLPRFRSIRRFCGKRRCPRETNEERFAS